MKTYQRAAVAALAMLVTALASGLGVSAAQASDTSPATHSTTQYVVATWAMPSWKNSSTPVWPQSLVTSVVTDQKSLSQGVVPECGYFQIDVYDYTSNADKKDVDALLKGGVLNGPSNPVREPLIGGGLGTAWKFVNKGECTTPSPSPSTTSPSPSPSTTSPSPSPSDTVTPSPSDSSPSPSDSSPSPSDSSASPSPSGSSSTPTPSDSTTPPQVVTVTPVAPGFLSPTCKYQATITIPPVNGVVYSINGTVVASGVHFVQPGSYTVTASPADGFTFTEGATTSWSRTFTAPSCTTTPPASPTTSFPETGGGEDLPKTGGSPTGLLAAAGALLAVGTGFLLATRRRGSHV